MFILTVFEILLLFEGWQVLSPALWVTESERVKLQVLQQVNHNLRQGY